VGKKMNDQLQIWRELGHEAQLFMHTHPTLTSNRFYRRRSLNIRRFRELGAKLKLKQTELMRLDALFKAVEAYRPDVIYLRSGMYGIHYINCFRRRLW
jgi:succinylglutamate desuccinylase